MVDPTGNNGGQAVPPYGPKAGQAAVVAAPGQRLDAEIDPAPRGAEDCLLPGLKSFV